MDERSARILEAAIQGYITSGEPVSSGWLFEHYDFGIKPAMIRLELDSLEEDGYLAQPYHSAGRVPTDLGYEFFAKRALALGDTRPAMAGPTLRELFEERAWPDLLARLSAELGMLSIAADRAREMVYKAGLEALVAQLNLEDVRDRETLRAAIHDFERVDERLPRAAEKMGEGPQVFIGKKSPVTRSEGLSVIGGNYHTGNTTIAIFAIGPKRMDYKKVIRIFKGL
ncbi:MAG TPA: hypothetical protein VHZ04_02045 [Candidatus Paceibacterota bacterium]|jgi:transcriptional regulator of heat shock response|nr:hypothetical protein [Candidatus Paceibacterota bacterium]